MKDENLECPFCGEREFGGFDRIGLKDHLLNYCSEFENVGSVK